MYTDKHYTTHTHTIIKIVFDDKTKWWMKKIKNKKITNKNEDFNIKRKLEHKIITEYFLIVSLLANDP